jgi:hypothetical protein
LPPVAAPAIVTGQILPHRPRVHSPGLARAGRALYRRVPKEAAVHAEPVPRSAVPALFKTLFIVFALLVVVAVGYAGWIVIRYWDQVGV